MVPKGPLGLLGGPRKADTPSPRFRADTPGSYLQQLGHVSHLGLPLPPKTVGPGWRLHAQAPLFVSSGSLRRSLFFSGKP